MLAPTDSKNLLDDLLQIPVSEYVSLLREAQLVVLNLQLSVQLPDSS